MECAPKNCGILGFNLLTETEKRAERKGRAKRLYEQGFSMEQIGEELKVAVDTVSRDLKEFSEVGKLKDRTSKRGRVNEGRPRGSGRKSKPRQTDPVNTQIIALHDKGYTSPQIANTLSLEGRAVRHAIHDEETKRAAKADPEIDRAELSLSAQEKLDAAIRQHKRKLDLAFESRVLEEVKRRIDEMILPHWKQKIEQAQKLYKHRRGAMDKLTFNKIRRALHPDSRHSISDAVLAAAFDTFMSLEKFLLNESDSPTDLSGLPETLAEWDKMRATRRSKRPPLGAVVPR